MHCSKDPRKHRRTVCIECFHQKRFKASLSQPIIDKWKKTLSRKLHLLNSSLFEVLAGSCSQDRVYSKEKLMQDLANIISL